MHHIFDFDFAAEMRQTNSTEGECKPAPRLLQREIVVPLTHRASSTKSDNEAHCWLNGVAIWHSIDYGHGCHVETGLIGEPVAGQPLVWSRDHKQAVHILDKKYDLKNAATAIDALVCNVHFDVSVGKFNIDFRPK